MVKIGKKAPPTAYNEFKASLAYNSIVQGTWICVADYQSQLCISFYNSSQAQNDEISYKFSCKAGSFTLCVLLETGPDRANMQVSIDGAVQGTIDCYSGSATRNVVKTLAVTIVGDGEHTLNFKGATRDPSSTGWYMVFTAWWLRD